MSKFTRYFIFAVIAVCLCAASSYAVPVVISVNGAMTLGGNSYQKGDLVRIDDPLNPGTTNSLYAAVLGTARNLDAVHVQSDGKILLSHDGSAYTLGGVEIRAGDVARYNPIGGATELYLKGNTATPGTDVWGNTTSIFRNSSGAAVSEDLTNISLLGNGHILLSTAAATAYLEYAGGGLLSFQDEDVVEYDPVAKKAVGVYFDATTYYTIQTAAFDILSSTEVLVTPLSAVTISGIGYTPQQLIKIDTSTGIASAFMTLPAGISQKIDAVYVIPEPATILLLGIGGVLLRRNRRIAG